LTRQLADVHVDVGETDEQLRTRLLRKAVVREEPSENSVHG
jgi:hypothetical protein